MLSTQQRNALIDHLTARYECSAILLHGSESRKQAKKESDIDLVVIQKDAHLEGREAYLFNGRFLDLTLYSEKILDRSNDEDLQKHYPAKILFDTRKVGVRFQKLVSKVNAKGPKKLSAGEITYRKLWSVKMLSRLANDQSVEANTRCLELILETLKNYFKVRSLWYQGIHQSLLWLKKNDLKSYRCFQRLTQNPSDAKALFAIVQRAFTI